jgi:hypothetical protein
LSTAWLPVEEAAALQHARDGGNARSAGGYVYPVVLAPAARSLSATAAYRFAQVLSAVLWALLAVPAYLIARRLVPHGAALAVAGLTAITPAAVYATAAVPEALALLLAVSSLAVLARASSRGSGRDAVAALVLAAAAALVGAWFALLPPALLAAYELPRNGRRSFLRWPRSLVFAGFAAFAYLVLAATAPEAGSALASPGATARAAAASFAVAVVSCGVVPALLAAVGARSPRGRPAAVLLACCLPALVLTAGMFGAAGGGGVDERPLLALLPLVLPLAASALMGREARLGPALAVAAFAALAAFALPALPRPPIVHAAGVSLLAPHGGSRAGLIVEVVAALAVASAVLLVARRRRLVIAAAVVLALLGGHVAAWSSVHSEARALAAAEPGSRGWVDRHAPPGARVVVVGPAAALGARTLAQLALWNRSIHGSQLLDLSTVDPHTGLLPVAASDVLARGVALSGTEIARSRAGVLMHAPLPVQLADTLDGLYPDGWSSGYVTYRRFGGPQRPGTVLVTVSRTAWTGADRPGHYSIFVGTLAGNATTKASGVIHAGQAQRREVPVPPPPFQVVVSVNPTFSPARLGGSSDTRQLGAQLTFAYHPNP